MPIKVTNEDFVEKLHNVNPNVIALEKYKKCISKIKFQCLIDGTIFEATPNNVLRGHGCPICGRKKGSNNALQTKIKINQNTLIGNKYPHLIKYLKNKDDAYLYGYTTRRMISWICPNCNFEFSKSMSSFSNGSFVCPNCIKNESYPNRFMFNVLTQLNIDFQREYSPDWIKPKRFDFYFSINNKQYIVEMDGGFHQNKETKKVDEMKDSAAFAHGIEVIRIDCNYKKTNFRFDYIKNSILKSDLSDVLNLPSLNFNQADKFALKSEINDVCELWDKYRDLDIIKDMTQLTLYTIKKYLKFGQENNVCSYNHEECMEERKQKRYEEGKFANRTMVRCDQTGEIFQNMKMANRKYNCDVHSFFYNHGTYAGQLPDGTKLTWTKIPKEAS